MLTRPQLAFLFHVFVLIAAMAFIVPALTGTYGALGYLLSLGIYWLGFCLPVIALHVWRQRGPRLFSEKLVWRDWFVPFLLLLQVCLIVLFAFVPNTATLTTHGATIAALLALINAPLEEAAWRGGFMLRFAEKPQLGFWLGWALFTAWHIPLLTAQGVIFDGGWMALVGGAAILGLLWSWIAWRTGSVFWVTLAHGLTNALTFWVFVEHNGLA